ncbi:MAG: substrate-binding domain-containing protein [Pseudonocardiaceae bacterium]
MNGYGNGVTFSTPSFPTGIVDGSGNRVVASFDAVPQPSTINTHPSIPACASIARPNGSGAGITALHNDASGCIQFARSSNNDSQDPSRNGFNLTYIPFATDVLTYVTNSQTGVPSNLTLATLTSLYSKNAGTTGCGARRPLLPQPNSGTRAAWLKLLGLTEATKGDCVKDTVNGVSLEEHDGRLITDGQMIYPYSVGKWVTQTTQPAITDIHGSTVLRAINGISPFDPTHPGLRTLYNVVRTGDIGTDPIRSTFVDQRGNTPPGPNAQVCLHPEVVKAFGFQLAPDCGSTLIHTN